jgi:hypothetical protein
MEREQQITKLVNVLRRTAASVQGDASAEVTKQAIGQYNRVLSTLSDLDEGAKAIFVPLEDDTGPEAVEASCHQLAAYFRDETGIADTFFDTDAFKDFWQKSAQDLEEVGDYIRESIEKMKAKKRRHETHEAHENGEESPIGP